MALSDYFSGTADLYSPRKDRTGMVETKAFDLQNEAVPCRLLPRGASVQRDSSGRDSGGTQGYRELLPVFVFSLNIEFAVGWRIVSSGKTYYVECVESMAGLQSVRYLTAVCRLLV